MIVLRNVKVKMETIRIVASIEARRTGHCDSAPF